MESIATNFHNSTSRREKILVLSIVANNIPLHELRNFIPGLSNRLYYKVCIIKTLEIKNFQAVHAATSGIIPTDEKFNRTKYDPAKLQHFMSFITS